MVKDIKWKVKFKSTPSRVFSFLNTDKGRASFWAETANEKNGMVHFKFINGQSYLGKILDRKQDRLFHLDYFHSDVYFYLTMNTKDEGTLLSLENRGVKDEDYCEVKSGWISVLMNMKSVIDYQVDLRNHDKEICWDQGFIGN